MGEVIGLIAVDGKRLVPTLIRLQGCVEKGARLEWLGKVKWL